MAEQVVFQCSLAPIMSAIRRGPDGVRVVIDIPETEVMNASSLFMLHGVSLKVTVEVVPSLTHGSTKADKRAAVGPLGVDSG